MLLIQNGNTSLALVPVRSVADTTGRRAHEPRAVVSSPVVVARRPERHWSQQHDHRRRDEDAVLWSEELRLEHRRYIRADFKSPFVQEDADREPAEEYEERHGGDGRLHPPGVLAKRGKNTELMRCAYCCLRSCHWRLHSGVLTADLSAFPLKPPTFYQRILLGAIRRKMLFLAGAIHGPARTRRHASARASLPAVPAPSISPRYSSHLESPPLRHAGPPPPAAPALPQCPHPRQGPDRSSPAPMPGTRG